MELRVTDLTKEFQGTTAVDHINLSMQNGVYGLLGVNGAGKTTFMRMLCTLIRPTGGSITYGGKDIFALDGEYRSVLGYLPQEFGFYPDFTVQDYLMYIASIKGIRPAAARKRIRLLLHQVGLTKVQNRKMKKLSGGMKRRVGIAQAMLNDPRILILDEPTAGLDPGERVRFRNLISELSQDRLVLLSTHIVSDIEYIANEILLMHGGRLVHTGTQEELLREAPVRAWTLTVPRERIAWWQEHCKVANIKTVPQGVELRVLLQACPDQAAELRTLSRECSGQAAELRTFLQECPALAVREEALTLEDLFLYYFGEKAGEEDDVF